MAKGIIIFGLNGSGKSTLAKALSERLKYKYMDIEDYYFLESDIPYTKARTRQACISLMLNDIEEHKYFVVSSVKGDFGDKIESSYELGVFLTAPKTLRMDRIEKRAISKFGNRVKVGGDMYHSEQKFMDFARSRSVASISKWSETLRCPILQVDGTKTIAANVDYIVDYLSTIE